MKFHQLPIGSRFRYKDRDYCKTSPLAASAGDGSQRMIPRSAVVILPEDEAGREAAEPFNEALQHHHERCRELLEQAAALQPEITRLELLKALEESYRELRASLDGID